MSCLARLLCALLGCLLMAPGWTACPPEAWMCSSPTRQTAPMVRENTEHTLFESGHFALQRDDSNPEYSVLRPVFKYSDTMRFSLKIHKSDAELTWKMDF